MSAKPASGAALPARLKQNGALALALALYLIVTVYGVLNDGYSSDDWRHINGASDIWAGVEGRWLLDVIYRYLLGERFLPQLQLTLAFPCFYGTAYLLAKHATTKEWQPAATLGIFAIGTNHIFMADVLSFSANIFAYPLALALSVAAFELIWRADGRPRGVQAAWTLASAILLSLSISIYQTFALTGLIIPVLALVRVDRVSMASAVRLAILGAVASFAALALYLLEWRLYVDLTGAYTGVTRLNTLNASVIGTKWDELPQLLRSLHTGTLLALPPVLKIAQGLFSLAALGLLGVAALGCLRQPGSLGSRSLAIARLGLGGGLLFFLVPVLFWLIYRGDTAPARAFGYMGFFVSAVFVSALTMSVRLFDSRLQTRRFVDTAVFGFLAVAVVQAFTTSAYWSDSARAGARDADLARATYARVSALPGYSGGPFRLAGRYDHPELSWGSLTGWSLFHPGNPNMGIYRALFGMNEDMSVLPVSPRKCGAFPASDAAFVHDGNAYLCLEELAPFTETLTCTPLRHEPDAALCIGKAALLLAAPDCQSYSRDTPQILAEVRHDGQDYAPVISFDLPNSDMRIGETCYLPAIAPDIDGFAAIDIRLVTLDGTTAWQERIEPGAFAARDTP
ncbi:MAG: glucosyltransferase domain-containing protein [Paracoccaceae bacterium]